MLWYDHVELRVEPQDYIRWPNGGGFQPVELFINGIPLIELVRWIELPYAEEEMSARIADGEDPEGLYLLAGDYHYLPTYETLYCNAERGFVLEPDDPRRGKMTLLGCTCGITECWFLIARVSVGEKTVVWSDFRQFHRDWDYDLGPFTFARKQYEEALRFPRSA